MGTSGRLSTRRRQLRGALQRYVSSQSARVDPLYLRKPLLTRWSPAAAQVGVRGKNVLVLGVEKKSAAKLQDARTVRKVVKLDQQIALTFAGLLADARVLINKARLECQSYRLTMEDAPTVEYISGFVAQIQQRFTQRGGRRPFGLSNFFIGFDADGTGSLYMTEATGSHSEWKANAIGRNAESVREFLQNNYDESVADEAKDADAPIKLAVKALLEVVESGAKNIEIWFMRNDGKGLRSLPAETVKAYCDAIEAQKEAEKNKKKKKKANA